MTLKSKDYYFQIVKWLTTDWDQIACNFNTEEDIDNLFKPNVKTFRSHKETSFKTHSKLEIVRVDS